MPISFLFLALFLVLFLSFSNVLCVSPAHLFPIPLSFCLSFRPSLPLCVSPSLPPPFFWTFLHLILKLILPFFSCFSLYTRLPWPTTYIYTQNTCSRESNEWLKKREGKERGCHRKDVSKGRCQSVPFRSSRLRSTHLLSPWLMRLRLVPLSNY